MFGVTESTPPPVESLFMFGANLGDRETTIERALALLSADCGPLVRSSVYETPPWGDLDQPPFLNVAARGVTTLAPLTLLRRCKEIERQLGRVPGRPWGPRLIDVDLLTYGRISLTTPELTLPHPRLHERAFVLVPLAEIASEWRHPVLDRTVAELLAGLPTDDVDSINRLGSAAH